MSSLNAKSDKTKDEKHLELSLQPIVNSTIANYSKTKSVSNDDKITIENKTFQQFMSSKKHLELSLQPIVNSTIANCSLSQMKE